MSSKFIFIVLMLNIYWYKPVYAQADADPVIERIIESIAERMGEDFDYSEIAERLNFYREHPVDINKTSSEQLSEFIFLTPLQINALLNHIEVNGDILELTELQSIAGFDSETIRKLTPFITVRIPNSLAGTSFTDLTKKGSHDIMFRFGQVLQPQQGYLAADTSEGNGYLGSPSRILLRYRYQYGQHLSASVNMEKDAGEQFFTRRQPAGFDFYSGNIFLRNTGRFSKITVGDYSLQFGQGLSLWSGLGIGRGVDITGAAKQDMGLRPYTSLNEALFFRGIAATLKVGRLLYTPFVSRTNFDASLALSPLNEQEIASTPVSGLHRTYTEIDNKNTGARFVIGNVLQYDGKNLNAGVTVSYTLLNYAFEKGKLPYNQFDFSARRLLNAGIHYNYTYKNSYFFGEVAHSINSGFAFINGVLTSLAPGVSVILSYRKYDKNYHSFYNQAFAEGSNAVNEAGVYTGLVIKLAAGFELSSYLDIFSFPWMKFRVDAPSKGYELSSQLTYNYRKRLRAAIRYRIQLKEENDDLEQAFNTLQPVERQNLRLELNYKAGESFTLRNRAEVCLYRKGTAPASKGYLVLQDLIYNPIQSRFSGNFRFAIFNTPDFDTRIYAYENDVLYSYSAPAYQNNGLRFYINGKYSLKRGLSLWARYSVTSYINLDEIGSGLDRIQGNRKSEVKLQIRCQF